MVRVWNFDKIDQLVMKVVEHSKDSFIYMNMLILIILSMERYVAVCKPQYYKSLETNINKIIWLFFLLGFSLAMTNYQNNAKSEFSCISKNTLETNTTELNSNKFVEFHFLFTYDASNNKTLNLNLLTSVFLFTTSACVSTWFYIQIGRYEWRRSRTRNRLFKLGISASASPKHHETTPAVPPIDAAAAQASVSIALQEASYNEDERQVSFASKSNASVQTDFGPMIVNAEKTSPCRRKMSTNFISSETITKISIWVRFFKCIIT